MSRETGELAAARDRFAADLDEVRGALHSELGWVPRGRRWLAPIVALAAGLVAGVALRRNLPRRRRELPPMKHRRP